MPELRDETTEDGFHEIQLSGKQLVFLFMATTVVSIFIFLTGVLVGRGVSGKPGDEPIDSSGATYAATEGEAVPAAGSATGEPPSPPAGDELSYHTRLQSNTPATEELKPTTPQPPPAPKPEAAAPKPEAAPAANVPTTGRPGTWVLQIVALRNQSAAASLVQRLVKSGFPAYLENPAPGTPVIYRVRVGRYSDRSEADQVRRRLEKEEQLSSVITR